MLVAASQSFWEKISAEIAGTYESYSQQSQKISIFIWDWKTFWIWFGIENGIFLNMKSCDFFEGLGAGGVPVRSGYPDILATTYSNC